MVYLGCTLVHLGWPAISLSSPQGEARRETHFLSHLVRVMQGMLPLREHPSLLVARQSAGEPGRQGTASDPNASQRHRGQVQRVQGRRLLGDRPEELKIQDAPNESTDTAS